MYGKPFNPKKPFGEIFGDNRFAFEQDGQLYNALHDPVDQDGNRMALDPSAKAAAPESKPAPAAATDDPDDDIPADELAFDLFGWAKGDDALKATPWAKVRAETARIIDDMSGITSKDAARKAILSHYRVNA